MQRHEALEDLFVDTLNDIYSAEKQILKALPKLARGAASDTLREAFLTHRDQTEDQIGRLDAVFEILGERPGRKTCEAMQGSSRRARRSWPNMPVRTPSTPA